MKTPFIQGIALQREDERGGVRARFDVLVPGEILELAADDSACVRFINPWGNTLFNQLQLPVLIQELTAMIERIERIDRQQQLRSAIEFLEASRETHWYVRFVGD